MRTENLAVMLTDMKGFTAATSRQSRAENAHMLALQETLLLPVVRAFGGRRVKSVGDGYLVLFDSPTAGLLCGMALQDRLWDYDRRVQAGQRIEVRVVVSLGEVRLVGSGTVPQDVYGEAVNLASRVEAEAEAGEVWFTEAVRLCADRRQVAAEEIGTRAFKGIDEEVRLYRVARGPSSGGARPPYGNAALRRVLGLAPPEPDRLARTIRRRRHALFRAGLGVAEAASRVPPRLAIAALVLALAAGGAWAFVAFRTERLIAGGDFEAASVAIEERAALRGEDDPKVLYLRGRLVMALAEAGRGGNMRQAYEIWSSAVAAGSGDALDALERESRSWECSRRRLAAHALAGARSQKALDALREIAASEPEATGAVARMKRFLGADDSCGTGEIARRGIRELEAEGEAP